jgi:hypothetical protein
MKPGNLKSGPLFFSEHKCCDEALIAEASSHNDSRSRIEL